MNILEIPSHERHILATRRSRYVLVIPVINEGDLINRQLEKIAGHKLEFDVVIADGG